MLLRFIRSDGRAAELNFRGHLRFPRKPLPFGGSWRLVRNIILYLTLPIVLIKTAEIGGFFVEKIFSEKKRQEFCRIKQNKGEYCRKFGAESGLPNKNIGEIVMRFLCRSLRVLILGALLLSVTCQPALAFDTGRDDQLLLLINREHTLAADWQPADLLDIAKMAPSSKSVMLLRDRAANAYLAMYAAYHEEKGRTMRTISGYRSYATQRSLFNSRVASRQQAGQSYQTALNNTALYTAYPGASEHQSGLAIDLSTNGGLSNSFQETEQGKWMLSRCWDFGFILRYAANKTPITGIAYEPWHYRYVGLPHAWIIRDNGWSLEEYMHTLHSLAGEQYLEYPDLNDEDMLYRVYYTKDTTREFADIVNVSSDNCGGYIITTHCLNEQLLNMPDETELTLNGQPVELPQPPYVQNGQTMVPLRAVMEALGAGLYYDQASHAIVASLGAATMPISAEQCVTVDDVNMAPLRLIAEKLQAQVEWDAENQTVIISRNEDELKIVMGRDSRRQTRRMQAQRL